MYNEKYECSGEHLQSTIRVGKVYHVQHKSECLIKGQTKIKGIFDEQEKDHGIWQEAKMKV